MTHYTATVAHDLRLDLPQSALPFVRPGQEIDIDLNDSAAERATMPNEALLAMLRDLQEMKKDMPESDPSDTNRVIREGRSGAMYGDPANYAEGRSFWTQMSLSPWPPTKRGAMFRRQ